MGFGTSGMYRRARERHREMDRKNHEWFEKQRQEQATKQESAKSPTPPVEHEKEDVK